MKKAKYAALVLAFLMVAGALAQGPDTVWTKRFGGNQEDVARGVARADGGEGYVTGHTYSYGSGLSDMYLIKLDPLGDTSWTKTVGGPQNDGAHAVSTSPEGAVVAGYTESYGAGGKDFYLVSMNREGDTTATMTYGGTSDEEAYDVARTMDDATIMAGYTESFGSGQKDMWIVRTGPVGETLWTRALGGSSDDAAHGVVGTRDNSVVAVGHRGGDLTLVKTDQEGNTLWQQTLGGSEDDIGYDVVETMDESYVVVGMTKSFCNGVSDVWVLKFNLEGETLWTKNFGGEGAEEGYSITETMDGGLVVAGMSIAATDGDTGAFVAKLDPEGNVAWSHVYGEDAVPEIAFGIFQGDDENFTFGGVACGANDDLWLVRILPFPSGIATPKPIRVSFADRVVPNPFSSRASISYQLSHTSRVSLAVYDMLGQEVKSLVSGMREAGSHDAVWGGTDALGNNVASGLYFIRLEVGDQTHTTKVLLER